jgi:thioredoxin 1
MAIIHVSEQTFKKEVEQSEKIVVLDFWAEWCGPCRMLGPVFEQLSQEMPNVTFAKVNVDEEPGLAEQFSIRGIPCLVLTKKGQEISRIVGFAPKDVLKQKISAVLKP